MYELSTYMCGRAGATPFPYTTLFRSVRAAAEAGLGRDALAAPGSPPTSPPVPGAPAAADETVAARASRPRDRKSTRLNSSHVERSSAHFGLEKKAMRRGHQKRLPTPT